MPNNKFQYGDLPQPTRPLDEMFPAADLLRVVSLAAVAGIGTALGSGVVVVLLALGST